MEYDMLAAPDYAVIAGVLAVFSIVGVYFRFTGGRQKTTKEFLRADGEIGVKTIIVSALPNLVTSLALVIIPADIYLFGTQYLIFPFGFFVGAVFTTYTFLPVIHNKNQFIVYEYLEARLGKGCRMTVTVLYVLQTVAFMSISLYGPAQALNAVTGLPIWTSVFSLTSVCMFYSLMGGLKAVLWTNILQALIMCLCVISVFVKGTMDAGGTVQVIREAYQEGQIVFPDFSASFTKRYTFWNVFLHGFFFGCYSFGCNQVQTQRLLSVKSLKKMTRASLICAILSSSAFILCFATGIVMFSLMHNCDPLIRKTLYSKDQLFPYTIMILFNGIPALRGLCVSGIFSSMLSIISSILNSLASVTLEDFIKPYCFRSRWTTGWEVVVAKMLVLAYAFLNILMVYILSLFPGIFEAYGVLIGVTAAPIVGVFLLGLFTFAANQKGALSGVALNVVLISWMGYGTMISRNVPPTLPRSTDSCRINSTGNFSVLINNSTNLIRFVPLYRNASMTHYERYVFPFYRVSFIWLLPLGVAICFTVGYICSSIEGFLCKAKRNVNKSLISPVIRSCFLFGRDDSNSVETNNKTNEQLVYSLEKASKQDCHDVVTKL